jgi:hypothetical protein
MNHSNGNGKKSNGSTLTREEAERTFNNFLLSKPGLQIYEMGLPYFMKKKKYEDWFMILKKDGRVVYRLRIDSLSREVSYHEVK